MSLRSSLHRLVGGTTGDDTSLSGGIGTWQAAGGAVRR